VDGRKGGLGRRQESASLMRPEIGLGAMAGTVRFRPSKDSIIDPLSA
jgi:hypothetical protein